MNQTSIVVEALYPLLLDHLSKEDINQLIEVPQHSTHGDLAFPVFTLARVLRKAPPLIAQELVEEMDTQSFDKVEVVGPYINFFLKRELVSDDVLTNVLTEENYGSRDLGHGKNVVIDMSSPNIAKPMSMGHLRSTVIGNAIANILKKENYTPIRINHLGDWGTQFGKLIVAYRKWGDEEKVRQNPIAELVKLYVKFHEEEEKDPTLTDEGRAAFLALENQEQDVVELWQWFKEESLNEFQSVYDMLDIQFDSYNGEAFYNDKMDPIVDELEEKGITKVDNRATIVDLEHLDMPPALIKKSDGASLYTTRDLAAANYRYDNYQFDKALYVVGNEQSMHFKQLKEVLRLMDRDWADDIIHVPFGLITMGGKKLSTRKGKVVLLVDVLNEAIKLALEQIEEKNPTLENKEAVAHDVGVGAVIFHDLKNDRLTGFDLNLEEIVQFEGETGPYIQYAHARAHSLLKRYGKSVDTKDTLTLNDDDSWAVVKLLADYPRIIERAATQYEPSVVAKYLIHLAQSFNKYYAHSRILQDDEGINSRIALVESVASVLADGLNLLGIKAPKEM
ncbi:arginine--tRNA ligase [Dolosicoccus paucivorans]|uniref:Arginine--tRNA ligase n=1 Tax=Dolosicoccus paucivorans TaxID=84521 RepID=A0A2N6SMC9_9LACT|nr:arginine--tRNA ligase [Dolosicoccus paucivorans]PMB84624.1 arginine--tRNA ligase [Dolosicoccus paucivorans]PMC58224.1 arginine--tRNA ligase [Dolosicoccus paucivorans]